MICTHIKMWKCQNQNRTAVFQWCLQFTSVQSLSRVWLCDPVDCSPPGLHVHHQLPQFTQTHVHRVGDPSNQLILCHPLLLPPSIFPSIRGFSMTRLFARGGQSIGVSTSESPTIYHKCRVSVLPHPNFRLSETSGKVGRHCSGPGMPGFPSWHHHLQGVWF